MRAGPHAHEGVRRVLSLMNSGGREMTVGVALLLIGAGAVLRFAVTAHISGVNLGVVGDILMAVGAVGLVIAVIWLMSIRHRRTGVVEQQMYAPPVVTAPARYATSAEGVPYEDPTPR